MVFEFPLIYFFLNKSTEKMLEGWCLSFKALLAVLGGI